MSERPIIHYLSSTPINPGHQLRLKMLEISNIISMPSFLYTNYLIWTPPLWLSLYSLVASFYPPTSKQCHWQVSARWLCYRWPTILLPLRAVVKIMLDAFTCCTSNINRCNYCSIFLVYLVHKQIFYSVIYLPKSFFLMLQINTYFKKYPRPLAWIACWTIF